MRIGPFVALLLVAFQAKGVQDAINDLRSNDRDKRLAAIKDIAGEPQLPVAAYKPLLDFARLEVNSVTMDLPGEAKVEEIKEMLPKVGDEVPLARIKADPGAFVGKRFVISGVAEVSDYWNYGYDNAESSHYSLYFRELGKDLRAKAESVHVYVPRRFGRGLTKRLTENAEKGAEYTRLRASVTILPSRYEGASNWGEFEVLDFQLLTTDKQGWQAGVLEGIGQLQPSLGKFGKDVIPHFVETLVKPADDPIDLLLKEAVGRAMLDLPKQDKPAAIAQLKNAVRKVKDEKLQSQIRDTIGSLESSIKPPPKPSSKKRR